MKKLLIVLFTCTLVFDNGHSTIIKCTNADEKVTQDGYRMIYTCISSFYSGRSNQNVVSTSTSCIKQ